MCRLICFFSLIFYFFLTVNSHSSDSPPDSVKLNPIQKISAEKHIKYLAPDVLKIKDDQFEKASLPVVYDELTQIGITPCYMGKNYSNSKQHIAKNIALKKRVEDAEAQEWPYRIHGKLIMKFGNENFNGTFSC